MKMMFDTRYGGPEVQNQLRKHLSNKSKNIYENENK